MNAINHVDGRSFISKRNSLLQFHVLLPFVSVSRVSAIHVAGSILVKQYGSKLSFAWGP